MAASPASSHAGPPVSPVHKAVQRLLDGLVGADARCADAMVALCRDRGAEIASIPVPLAAPLVRNAVESATLALSSEHPSKWTYVLSTLRHLLAFPSLRDVAIKASRLKSLATCAIAGAWSRTELPFEGDAAAAVLTLLQEIGVDITSAGTLEQEFTPFMTAIARSFLKAAQVLLDAGADVNGLSRNGLRWPLFAAALSSSDASMAWLLEHGASLTTTNCRGRTIAHVLAMSHATGPAAIAAVAVEFFSRCLRWVSAAEPSLLEVRDEAGHTPLLSASSAGSKAGVGTLLELGADAAATNPAGETALSLACNANSLPAVCQLIAAGAASVAALPPGSPQARTAASAATAAAVSSEQGCGECVARCGGSKGGDCADGLDILRAVLAAGVREAVGAHGRSLGFEVVSRLRAADASKRVSEEHALAILQALHAVGVDVLAAGPADELPVLHSAAGCDAPALVRWLVNEAGAPLEEGDYRGDTPLLDACATGAWAAAHALLDCGARVDVQSADDFGMWPVLLAARQAVTDITPLQRMLVADCDSLSRSSASGLSAVHFAAALRGSPNALRLMLGSGLPHLTGAINAVAGQPIVTPLHLACSIDEWASALVLLAAGARVDIAGTIDGRHQTIAEWARSSPACKHRGVKLAVAARAREHAAQASVAAKGLPPRGAGSVAGDASAAASAALATAESGSASAGSGAAADFTTSVSTAAVATGPAAEKGKQAKGRKGRRGAASNRAEELPLADEATHRKPPCVVAASPLSPLLFVIDGSVEVLASAAAPVATASAAAPSTCEHLAAAAAVAAAGDGSTAALNAQGASASALNLPEDPLSQPAVATRASVGALAPPAHHIVAAAGPCTEGSTDDCVARGPTGDASAAGPFATNNNTCEPSADSGSGANTCEPGAAAEADFNSSEPGEGAPSSDMVASTAGLQTGGSGEATDSTAAEATWLAALQDEGASAAVVRRHLAALSELARDPAAAAALIGQGSIAVVIAALARHGAAVAVAASPLLALLGAAAAEGGEVENEE